MIAPTVLGALASGCVSFSDGPARLYTVPEETQLIRDQVQQINLVQYSSLDEASRKRIRNDYIAARMYAIDIQYTPYEAALTKERQGVGFGAAATTVALTTASGLVSPVATKNVLTGLAGFVTGARAAYDSDVLLSHSVQWIQSQMEANRAYVSNRILNGMKQSTTDYPLAAALSDLEAYYRAGTFTGGLLSTSEVIAADAQNAADSKALDQGQLGPAPPPPPRPKPVQNGGNKTKSDLRQQACQQLANNSTPTQQKICDFIDSDSTKSSNAEAAFQAMLRGNPTIASTLPPNTGLAGVISGKGQNFENARTKVLEDPVMKP
jgi:hypothetical protein